MVGDQQAGLAELNVKARWRDKKIPSGRARRAPNVFPDSMLLPPLYIHLFAIDQVPTYLAAQGKCTKETMIIYIYIYRSISTSGASAK